MLFAIRIPNLACGCILGWQCRVPFYGHCDLDLVFFNILFVYYLRLEIPNLVCALHLWRTKCQVPSLGNCELNL